MAQPSRHRPLRRALLRLLLLALPLQCVLAVVVAAHGGRHLHLSWPDLGAWAGWLQCQHHRVTEGASPLLRHGAGTRAAAAPARPFGADNGCDDAGRLAAHAPHGHGHDHHDHGHAHPPGAGAGADDHAPADEATRLSLGASADEAGDGAPSSPPWLAWLPLGWVLLPATRRRAVVAAAPPWHSRCVPPPQRPPRQG